MDDLDATRLCAEAIGLRIGGKATLVYEGPLGWFPYDPIHDDAQAMALEYWLIERGYLHYEDGNSMFYAWPLETSANTFSYEFKNKNERRKAIVYCVAKMRPGAKQESKDAD